MLKANSPYYLYGLTSTRFQGEAIYYFYSLSPVDAIRLAEDLEQAAENGRPLSAGPDSATVAALISTPRERTKAIQVLQTYQDGLMRRHSVGNVE